MAAPVVMLRTIVFCVLLLGAGGAACQEDVTEAGGWESVPAEAIGSWRFDPGEGWEPDGPNALIVGLRAALGSGLMRDSDALIASKILLALTHVGQHPHRAVVLGFEARPEGVETGMILERFDAVLEVRTSRSHRPLVSTLKAGLTPPAGEDVKAWQASRTVAGIEVVEFRRDDLPEWAVFSWASEPGVFTVAFGGGVMDRWLASRGGGDAPGELAALRGLKPPFGSNSRVVFEAWADVNALRHGFPEAFDESRAERIFNAMSIKNARSVGLVATAEGAGPGPLVLDYAVTSRTQRPGTYWTERLTQVVGEPDSLPGRYTLRFDNRLIDLEQRASAVFTGALRRYSQLGQKIRRRQWMDKHGGAFREIARSIDGDIIVVTDAESPVRFPGIGVAVARVRRNIPVLRIEDAVDRVLGSFAPVLRKDRKSGLWSIVPLGPDRDPTGLLRLGALGVLATEDGALLVAGWSEGAVRAVIEEGVRR